MSNKKANTSTVIYKNKNTSTEKKKQTEMQDEKLRNIIIFARFVNKNIAGSCIQIWVEYSF